MNTTNKTNWPILKIDDSIKGSTNDLEVNFAKEENIDESLLKNENLEIDTIAKAKILHKIDAFNNDLNGILDNDGKQLKIDKYTRRKILKEYENILF